MNMLVDASDLCVSCAAKVEGKAAARREAARASFPRGERIAPPVTIIRNAEGQAMRLPEGERLG